MNTLIRSRMLIVLLAVGAAVFALSCARQPAPSGDTGAVMSFVTGLVQGFIMLFSLIASWFTDVRIYAYPNSGFWYDIGYVIGASVFFAGSGAGAKSKGKG